MQTQLPPIVYIVFTAITALGVLLQAFVLLGMFFAIRESSKKMHEVTSELRSHALPVIGATQRLIEDLSPKLKVATENLVEITHTLRQQTRHANATVDDVLNKTTVQVARINEMTGAVLDSVEYAAAAVQHSMIGPYRQAAGILAGIKAGFGVLLGSRTRTAHPEAAEGAEEVIPR